MSSEGETGLDRLGLIAAMGRDFAASLDIEATLEKALDRITREVSAVGGALFLLDGATLTCHASGGGTDITGLTLPADKGIVGRCVTDNASQMVRDVSKDPSFHGGFDEKTGFQTKSIICAPMSVQDQRIGAIELVNKAGGDGLFSDEDLTLLEALSTSAALAILNARQAAALVEQERVKRELELAAEIQRTLLPEPRDAPYPVHGLNHPARMVSGDFYDYFELDDGRICFNIGDVSGKGMNAALLMAKTASLFRCLGKAIHQPGRLLTQVNAEICETVTRGMFVTMVGGIYDPETRVVRLANAGHEPPLVFAPDGTCRAIEAEAPPLGVIPFAPEDEGFPETEIKLDGGALYMFTDGVTEGRKEDGEQLGADAVMERIREFTALPLAERLDTVVEPLSRTEGPLYDDITIIAVDSSPDAAHERPKPAADPVTVSGRASEEPLLKIHFNALPDRLKLVRSAVSEAAKLCGCNTFTALDIVLAVDEACQNVIRHAYGHDPEGEIEMEIRRNGGELIILLRDFAETVDPETIKPRDLDDVRPGGLGTHFINEIMDSVEWLAPDGGGNLLKLVKKACETHHHEA